MSMERYDYNMAMKYKLESFVQKITSPVVVEYDGDVQEFTDGKSAYEQDYFKCIIIDEIAAINGKIRLVLKTNDNTNDVSWTDSDVSFF